MMQLLRLYLQIQFFYYSAGAGRTGTFIAVDYLIEEGKSEGTVCILSCLQKLREQRSQMVQTQVNNFRESTKLKILQYFMYCRHITFCNRIRREVDIKFDLL